MAWELFSPIHRVLIVAVVAVAAADLKKSRQIFQLLRSLELRDQVLSNMQQKLDSLCEQMNSMKDQAETGAGRSFLEQESKSVDTIDTKPCNCHCKICSANNESAVVDPSWNSSTYLKMDSDEKELGQDEMFKMIYMNGTEQEERRMSDLSDWCSSVTSSAEIHLSSLAIEQDIYNLQKECDEKDATIKELANIARASEIAGSKRISELEDIIRRKNMIITKLKKDMVVLEQQVLHLTRIRRPSFSASNYKGTQLPVMAQNVLYDMDSSTSPSSSDSDSPLKHVQRRSEDSFESEDQNIPQQEDLSTMNTQKSSSAKTPISLLRSTNGNLKQRSTSPLKENSMNQRTHLMTELRPRQLVSSVQESKKNRGRIQSAAKDVAPQTRWV